MWHRNFILVAFDSIFLQHTRSINLKSVTATLFLSENSNNQSMIIHRYLEVGVVWLVPTGICGGQLGWRSWGIWWGEKSTNISTLEWGKVIMIPTLTYLLMISNNLRSPAHPRSFQRHEKLSELVGLSGVEVLLGGLSKGIRTTKLYLSAFK